LVRVGVEGIGVGEILHGGEELVICHADSCVLGEEFVVEIQSEFARLTGELNEGNRAYILAEMNDLLTAAPGGAIPELPAPGISDAYLANYVAAMVEQAAYLRKVRAPGWTSTIEPLAAPVFAVPWMSLRAHLLISSPVAFKRRNIFIDTTIGGRV
jgi:hypothetical protein